MKFATAYLENLYPNVCLRLSSKLTFFPRFVGEVHTYYLCSLDHRQSNNPCLTPTAHPLIACVIKTPWLVKDAKLRTCYGYSLNLLFPSFEVTIFQLTSVSWFCLSPIFSENNLMIKDFSFSIICKDNTFKICPLLF